MVQAGQVDGSPVGPGHCRAWTSAGSTRASRASREVASGEGARVRNRVVSDLHPASWSWSVLIDTCEWDGSSGVLESSERFQFLTTLMDPRDVDDQHPDKGVEMHARLHGRPRRLCTDRPETDDRAKYGCEVGDR